MKQAVQVKCPHCQNLLRVPADAVNISLICKHCGHTLQLKKKSRPDNAKPPAKPAVPPVAPIAVKSQTPKPIDVDELPEFTPPEPLPAARKHPPVAAPLSLDDDDSGDYTPAFESAGRRHSGRGKYKGPRQESGKLKWVLLGSIFVIGFGALAVIILKPEWFKDKPAEPKEQVANNTEPSGGSTPSGKSPTIPEGRPQPVVTGPFPRRVLAIGVNNYLYANPILSGYGTTDKESERRDFWKVAERLASSWKVPKDQFFAITDGPQAEGKIDLKHPPLKPVVTGTIERFLATSRPQDRIVLLFAGHAVEKEGKAYLTPLEGELDEVDSLIPLDDVYAQLEKCPAQEKLVIFDVCRFDPGRGVERPAFGVMTEELEKALHKVPDGVTVWTSCSAGQYSYEYDSAQVGKTRLEGSVFLSSFVAAELKGKLGKPAAGNIASPSEPLPLTALSEFVGDLTNQAAKDLEKKEQKPKLTSKARKEWLAYDPKETLAANFAYPAPRPTANREVVVAMIKELALPPINALRKEDSKEQKLADSFPFSEEAIKSYLDRGPTFADIEKAPEKYIKDYPLRVATVQALVEMRKLKQENSADEPPEKFESPITDQKKKEITDKFQRIITTRQGILEEQRENLEQAGKKKEMEKSKRWLANYDYALAQVRIRLAYIYEYNLALGKVKLEQLPELEMKHKGWKLASTEKMISPKEIRDLAEEGKNLLSELVKEHPNTPWAVVAKTQRHIILGLQWKASSLGAEPDEK